MRGLPCAPLLVLVWLLLPLLLLLLYFCNRFVNSSPYLAFHPFPAEAALGRQIIKISISFHAGQRSLLFDLNSIACMVAQGLHDRTRTQQTFPQINELQRRDETMEPKKPFHEVVAEKLIEQIKAGTAP